MSTRAIIARSLPDGEWEGAYHHWDGYPSGLGKTLWDMLHGGSGEAGALVFDSVEQLLSYVIDEHPAGWSHLYPARVLVKDSESPSGWDFSDEQRPECYCHGYFGERDDVKPDRSHLHSPAKFKTRRERYNAALFWEYIYIFERDHKTLTILANYCTGEPFIYTGVSISGERYSYATEMYDWFELTKIDLTGREPDWANLDALAKLKRKCLELALCLAENEFRSCPTLLVYLD